VKDGVSCAQSDSIASAEVQAAALASKDVVTGEELVVALVVAGEVLVGAAISAQGAVGKVGPPTEE